MKKIKLNHRKFLSKSQKKSNKRSNCVNTVSKFYHPSIEKVEKLKFYDPNFIKESLMCYSNNSSKRFSTDDKEKLKFSSLSKK